MTQSFIVRAGEARKLLLRVGTRLRVTSVHGGQVGDLIAYNADDLNEFLSPPHTRAALMSIRLRVGDALYSNRGRPLLRMLEDSVGVHDMLAPACDDYRYRIDFGVCDHRSCVENFATLMAEHGIGAHQLPDPLNVFEAVPVAADGSLGIVASPAPPGGCVTFQAQCRGIVCVSACPQDLAPTNNYRVSDLQLEVLT